MVMAIPEFFVYRLGIVYSLITFLYSATAILDARYAFIRFVWACVHESCADSTSTMLAFPSL